MSEGPICHICSQIVGEFFDVSRISFTYMTPSGPQRLHTNFVSSGFTKTAEADCVGKNAKEPAVAGSFAHGTLRKRTSAQIEASVDRLPIESCRSSGC